MLALRGIGLAFAIGLILTAFSGQAQETRRQEVLGGGTSTKIAQLFFKASRIVHVSGYDPSLQVGLVVDQKNAGHPIVKAVREFAKSAEWLEIVKSAGLLPPGK